MTVHARTRRKATTAKKATSPRTTTTGTTHHGATGVHARSRSGTPLPHGAKVDAWKHKGQAKGQP